MPFGYPDKIFKYPAVQYIPLQLYNIKRGTYPYSQRTPNFNIFKPDDNNKLNQQLKKINPASSNYNINEQQLAILIFNGIVDIIKYRAHQIFMVGSITLGQYYLFKITDKYFYKDKLLFSFYDGKSSEKIDQERFDSKSLN